MNPQRVGLLLLMVGLLLVWGCEDGQDHTHCYFGPYVGAVLIFLPTDTLAFLPGDTASVDGWVVVTDESGRVMPNVKVVITLPESFGSIELITGTDSTDGNGRVYFRFRSFDQTGQVTIRAQVGDKVDTWPLTVLPVQSRRPVHVNITISKPHADTLAHLEDSLLICLTFTDSLSIGVPNFIPPIRLTGGRMTPVEPTDANGRTCFWWYLVGISAGHHCLYFSWAGIADSICVDVVATYAVQIVLPVDTLTYYPGDSASVDGYVTVTDAVTQQPAPGVPVELTLIEPLGFLRLTGATGDTSDADGRVPFYFRSYSASGMTTIRAQVGNVVDLHPLWVIPLSDPIVAMHVWLSPDTIAASDSARFCVLLLDSIGQGVSGHIVPVSASGGRLMPLPATDAQGTACSWWYPEDGPGSYCINAAFHGLYDQACVVVHP